MQTKPCPHCEDAIAHAEFHPNYGRGADERDSVIAKLEAALALVVADVDEHLRSIRALGEATSDAGLWLAVSHDAINAARAALESNHATP